MCKSGCPRLLLRSWPVLSSALLPWLRTRSPKTAGVAKFVALFAHLVRTHSIHRSVYIYHGTSLQKKDTEVKKMHRRRTNATNLHVFRWRPPAGNNKFPVVC